MYTFKVIPNPPTKTFQVIGDESKFLHAIRAGEFIIDPNKHSKTLISTSIMAGETCMKVNREADNIKQKFYSTMNYLSGTRSQEYLFRSKSQGYKEYTQYLTYILDRLDVPEGTTVNIRATQALLSMVGCPTPVKETHLA